MKISHISAAVLACASLIVASCEIYPNGYSSISYSTNGYSSSVSWTAASYDANGFPIYGYYYGRPVYGYTAAGAAIFTIAAITASCFVPDWGPAPWYHGHHHYPPHVHRHASPPHHAHGHKPHQRPQGGMNAPIHRNPSSVLGPARPAPHGKPGHDSHGRPNHNAHRPDSRPNHNASRPDHRPSHNTSRPESRPSRPSGVTRPSASSSGSSRPSGASRPSTGRHR